jgi:hypothetical protein
MPLHRTLTWVGQLRADSERRTITGAVVPYGVVGQSMFGPIRVAAGAVELPDDLGRIVLLLDHDTSHPVGYATAAADGDGALTMRFSVPAGDAGDRALADAGNRLRSGLSIGGDILDADEAADGALDIAAVRLREVSLVAIPAFDDARVASVAATYQTGDPAVTVTDNLPALPGRPAVTLAADLDDALDAAEVTPFDDDHDDDSDTVAAALGPARHPSNRQVPNRTTRPAPGRDLSLAGVCRMLASTGGDFRQVRAALTNVNSADVAGAIQPQYVNDLLAVVHEGTPAIDAFASGNVTSSPLRFPYWSAVPTIGIPASEKAAIPTGPVTITSRDTSVSTYAGGNDISVQAIDWSSADFLSMYFEQCAEVYAQKIEQAFETALLASATGHATTGTLLGDLGWALGAVAGSNVGGALVMLVSADIYAEWFTTLAGGGPGQWGLVNPSFPTPTMIIGPYLPPNTLIVGKANAARSYQNAGAPIRLRAVDVSLLGVDVGVYGYFAAVLMHADALYKITGLTTAVMGMPTVEDRSNARLAGPVDLLTVDTREQTAVTSGKRSS